MKRGLGIIFIILGIGGAATMYKIGSDSSHLSELLAFYWTPLPLAVIGLFMIAKKTE
jgi:hypothetical protein